MQVKVIASIQARMGSSRLPGKVLKEAAGKPLLEWQVMRLRQSKVIDEVVVATTVQNSDDVLARWCNSMGITCFRGPENDVLGRISGLIEAYDADVHVECFGDSPLIDPQIVDQFVAILLKNQGTYDFVSSNLKTTYPPGFEVVVYFGAVLRLVDQLVKYDDPMREHASVNVLRFPNEIRVLGIEAPNNLYAPDTYLEVDTAEDFKLVSKVLENFRDHDVNFGLSAVLDFLRGSPHLAEGNRNVERRWREFRTDV